MMWRARDPSTRPTMRRATRRTQAVVEELYRGLDAIVTDTLAELGPDDLLVVMSDHGFTTRGAARST
jgi:phosphopentomutase